MKRKLLITGFDPFGGASINPAWEAVKLLPEIIADFEVHKLEIPTVFGLAAQKVLEKADEVHPDVILCIGQAGGRAAVTPERIGVNIRDAGLPGQVSNSAGAFVCNDTLYSLLHRYAGTDVKVGFVHVPYAPEQGQPNLPQEQTAAALEAAIRAV